MTILYDYPPGSGYYEPPSSSWLTNGEETMPRDLVTGGSAATGTGNLRLTYFTARKTESISQIRVASGPTAAAATPTLIRMGIWIADLDGSLLSLVGNTASDLTLLATINTWYLKGLAAAFTKQRGVRYGVGLLVVTAAAAPTIYGTANGEAVMNARSPRLNAVVSGQADLPATLAAASLGGSTQRPYFELVP